MQTHTHTLVVHTSYTLVCELTVHIISHLSFASHTFIRGSNQPCNSDVRANLSGRKCFLMKSFINFNTTCQRTWCIDWLLIHISHSLPLSKQQGVPFSTLKCCCCCVVQRNAASAFTSHSHCRCRILLQISRSRERSCSKLGRSDSYCHAKYLLRYKSFIYSYKM